MDKRIFELIEENSIWFMYSSEKSDPYFCKYISNSTIAPAISIISKDRCVVIVHELDSNNIKDSNVDKEIYCTSKELQKIIRDVLEQMNFPKTICFNYSTQNDVKIDVLGHGTHKHIKKLLNSIYVQEQKEVEFKSAEDYIYSIEQRNTNKEIQASQYAATRALEILEEAFSKIRVGMSEKDISNLVHEIFDKKPDYFEKIGVVKEEYSWEQENCPIVLVGENLKSGGHSIPSNKKIKKGNTVYFDFGVKLTFKNGVTMSSDIQRTGYVLNDNETCAPASIQKPFDTLIEAIDLGIEAARPGIEGYVIDEIVRGHIQKANYPDYNHGTGHPVKKDAHSIGTSLSPRTKHFSKANMCLQETGIYTIEPRIPITNGCSVEEMVLITKDGGKTMCKRQKKLYLIKG